MSVQHLDYNIPPEIGEAWLEQFEVHDSFSLYRAVLHLDNNPYGQFAPMIEFKCNDPENIFSAQTWLSGSGRHQEY